MILGRNVHGKVLRSLSRIKTILILMQVKKVLKDGSMVLGIETKVAGVGSRRAATW